MNILYRETDTDDYNQLAELIVWGLGLIEDDTIPETVAILRLPDNTIITKAPSDVKFYDADIIVYFATVLGTGIYTQYLNKTPDQIQEIVEPSMMGGTTLEVVNPINLTMELTYTKPIA